MIPNEYHSYDEAVRGEVTDRLNGFCEGVQYTEEHVRILAERLIMPRSNGTFTGSAARSELFDLAYALGILPRSASVACPVPWCAGSSYEHGGDGRTADEFEHSPAVPDWLAPRPLLRGEFYQVGDTPPFYRLDAEAVRDTPLLTVSEVRALADDFERHAVTLRERAAQLEALGGIQ